MNISQQLIGILEEEGLRIVDKRGLPSKTHDEKMKAWADQLLLDSFDSYMEYFDEPDERKIEETHFKTRMGIPLNTHEKHIASTLNF